VNEKTCHFSHIFGPKLAIPPQYPRLIIPLVAALLAFVNPLIGQIKVLSNGQPLRTGLDVDLHPDSPSRTKIDLSGAWTVSTDGVEWQEIAVPSSIDEVGTFTFRRTFTLTEKQVAEKAFTFVAYGINYDAEVTINDIYIGRHIGGYTTVQFEIPDNAVAAGSENAIQIVVHNQLSARTSVPTRMTSEGWRTYGGITRGLFLLGTPRLWIDHSSPRLSFNSETREGRVAIRTLIANRGFEGLSNDTATSAVERHAYLFGVELVDRATEAVVAQSAPQVLTLEPMKDLEVQSTLVVSNARGWRVDQPDLYVLRTTVYQQEARQRTIIDQTLRVVGFPTITKRKGQFYENGVRLRLQGVTWREDDPEHGASLTYEQMDRDMAMIKSLGANAVRFAYHPPHPYLLNLCARYGLYALVELPVWNVPGAVLEGEGFRAVAEPMVREMVDRDAANPAVLAWGLGDRLAASDERTVAFVKDMASIVRSIDARPVYAGIAPTDADGIASVTDLAAVHLTGGDLRGFRASLQELKIRYADRPLLVLSYGVPVDHHNRSGYRDHRSQEYQARYYLQHIAAVKDAGVAGGFVAAFTDWRGDRPVLTVPSGDRTLHPYGLASAGRERRLAFDVVRAQYQDVKFPAIPAGSYRPAFPAAHVLTGLFIIILLGYQYSYNRRFAEAVKRSFLRSYNFFADLRDRRDVPLMASAVLALCLSSTVAVVLSGLLYHYRTDPFADRLLTAIVVSDLLKEQIAAAAWEPVRGIALLTVVVLVLYGLLTLLIRLIAWIARVRIPVGRAWLLTVWGSLPLVMLSPVGMSLFKIMENDVFVVPVFFIVALVAGWAGLRVLKAMSVVFDITPARTYAIAIVVGLLIVVAAAVSLDTTYALRAALEHLFATMPVEG
jgi:beta-galactosidase